MPKTYSLSRKNDFDFLFSKGFRLRSHNFNLIYTSGRDSFRIAFIISKKNAKKSTDRNYSKRILREIVRRNLLNSLRDKKIHIALVCKTNLREYKAQRSFAQIQNEVLGLFEAIQNNCKFENLA